MEKRVKVKKRRYNGMCGVDGKMVMEGKDESK